MNETALIIRSTLASQARRARLDRILAGRIAPGERINETRLAEELGVSRTSMRFSRRASRACSGPCSFTRASVLHFVAVT
jgi:hypothetical protein